MAKLLSSTHSWLQTRKGWMLTLGAALLFGLPFLVFQGFGAQFDAFLKIEGIDGESVQKGKEKWIELESFSWGMTNTPSAGGGGGTGKVSVHDISITKNVDKSSPLLMLRCCTGNHIPEALLSYTKVTTAGPVEYLKIKLTDVFVSSYNFGGGGGSGDAMPVDSISINFTKIEMTYIPVDISGNAGDPVTASCDLTNQIGQ